MRLRTWAMTLGLMALAGAAAAQQPAPLPGNWGQSVPGAVQPGVPGGQSAPGGDAATAGAALGPIRAMERLPDTWSAVETDEMSGMLFVSANGRFVIKGKLYDAWSGKSVDSIDELRQVATRIDLKRLNLKIDDLSPFKLGSGPEHVTIFVDPLCPYCHQLLSQLNAAGPALAKYTFDILVVPVLGQPSEERTRHFSCATDKANAFATFLAGIRAVKEAVLPQDPGCDLVPIQKRLVTAQLLGVRGVPFLIANDGRTKAGLPQNVSGWLMGSAQ